MNRSSWIVLLAATVACSSSSSSSGSPDAAADTGSVVDSCAPVDSACGQPCDPGNSLGVGHYCKNIQDCFSLPKAHLCSVLGGSGNTFFCTFRCSIPPEGGTAGDGGTSGDDGGPLPFPTDCGSGASCTCDNMGNCGCTPNVCLTP